MKKSILLKYLFIFISSFFLFAFVGEPDNVNNALKSGNASALKQYMNSTVELVILEKENVYSNIQAEQILKQFFSQHKPESFQILHNGGNNNSQYYIGLLKTKTESFRIYYLLKIKDKKTLIYQLRIESDE